ncbi:Peptidase A4 family domain containing protein [Amanita muscaria]
MAKLQSGLALTDHGNSCNTILQTGIYISYQNGAVSYDSWYEWLPDLSYSYDSPIAIRAGDVIRLTVTASSTTSGTTLIENLTTGQSESQSLSSPSYPLCLQNAEWIIEDFKGSGSMVPFCDFGTVAFSSASAYLHNGRAISPNGAMVLNIEQNGKVLTSVSESSSGTSTQLTLMPASAHGRNDPIAMREGTEFDALGQQFTTLVIISTFTAICRKTVT